jgi:hypothetical protein
LCTLQPKTIIYLFYFIFFVYALHEWRGRSTIPWRHFFFLSIIKFQKSNFLTIQTHALTYPQRWKWEGECREGVESKGSHTHTQTQHTREWKREKRYTRTNTHTHTHTHSIHFIMIFFRRRRYCCLTQKDLSSRK